MTYEKKIISLNNAGHEIDFHYHVSSNKRKIIIDKYDSLNFKTNFEDQQLAREMLNLDYDILCLQTKEGE